MGYFQLGLSLMVIQHQILTCLGMCDQRILGGELKCCEGKQSKCFVKVQSERNRGQTNTICYCDSYCKFTNDCCEDFDKIQKLCSDSRRDCEVSAWDQWSDCNTECGIGIMRRRRKVLEYPKSGGKKCPTLRQTRGCNRNTLCDKNKYATAFILPISYRRPTFGQYIFENILPASEGGETKIGLTYSYCVHYRLTFRRKSCEATWAAELVRQTPVCVECQSRVMEDGGHCRGEGALGVRTRWKALGLDRCHGDWIRLGEIIPNCICGESQFSNFVFV